jgi:hypothetical protein
MVENVDPLFLVAKKDKVRAHHQDEKIPNVFVLIYRKAKTFCKMH